MDHVYRIRVYMEALIALKFGNNFSTLDKTKQQQPSRSLSAPGCYKTYQQGSWLPRPIKRFYVFSNEKKFRISKVGRCECKEVQACGDEGWGGVGG